MAWRGGRRRFLDFLASWLPVAGAGLAARPAAAFRVLPQEDYEALVTAACRPAPEHARLLEAFRASLPAEVTPERTAAMLKDLRCPTCGCPLAVAAAADLPAATGR